MGLINHAKDDVGDRYGGEQIKMAQRCRESLLNYYLKMDIGLKEQAFKKPLTEKLILDPKSQIASRILKVASLDTTLLQDVNKVNQSKDIKKYSIDTLGPFSSILTAVLNDMQRYKSGSTQIGTGKDQDFDDKKFRKKLVCYKSAALPKK